MPINIAGMIRWMPLVLILGGAVLWTPEAAAEAQTPTPIQASAAAPASDAAKASQQAADDKAKADKAAEDKARSDKDERDQCGGLYADATRGPASSPVVQLVADTFWRPRSAAVRFTVSGGGATLSAVKRVSVCFRWSKGKKDPRADVSHSATASPLVSRIDDSSGKIIYAAQVPDLTQVNLGLDGIAYSGVGTVPLADMLVVAVLDDAKQSQIIVSLPVGITYVPAAIAVVMFAVGLTFWVLVSWAPTTWGAGTGLAWVSNRALAIIATSNGIASLSQFQIMLWTFVVGGAAVYVMVLSGNLIPITSGTLTLLGIAGGASILGRVPTKDEEKKVPVSRRPSWKQLLLDGTNGDDDAIDVTRVQMLVFTLISAAFVAIKVAVSYEIPAIPENFLLLMGISNGVYIAGKQIPSGTKGGAAPP